MQKASTSYIGGNDKSKLLAGIVVRQRKIDILKAEITAITNKLASSNGKTPA